MNEELDPTLMFETLAASLELDKKETRSLIETVASMLQGSIPEQVSIKRGGWLLSKDKPIEELLVKFDELHYQIIKEKGSASYQSRELKVVRGIALKSVEIDLHDCIERIIKELSRLSEKSSRMRDALDKFIRG